MDAMIHAVAAFVFPAHAGVILVRPFYPGGDYGFPRTRGGDPVECEEFDRDALFSPHTRG